MTYKDDISPLSKIIIIAENYAQELIIWKENNPDKKAPKKQILEELREKFPKHTYKKIIKVLEEIEI